MKGFIFEFIGTLETSLPIGHTISPVSHPSRKAPMQRIATLALLGVLGCVPSLGQGLDWTVPETSESAEMVALFFALYTLIWVITFPIAVIAFGIFYAKQEGKSKVFGIFVSFAAIVLAGLLSFITTLLLPGLFFFAGIYVADHKNRNRWLWAISALLLGPPLLLLLLYLSAKEAEAPTTLYSSRDL